jgi:hypothetical protein
VCELQTGLDFLSTGKGDFIAHLKITKVSLDFKLAICRVVHLLRVLVEHLQCGGGGDGLATDKDGEHAPSCGLSLQHFFRV